MNQSDLMPPFYTKHRGKTLHRASALEIWGMASAHLHWAQEIALTVVRSSLSSCRHNFVLSCRTSNTGFTAFTFLYRRSLRCARAHIITLHAVWRKPPWRTKSTNPKKCKERNNKLQATASRQHTERTTTNIHDQEVDKSTSARWPERQGCGWLSDIPRPWALSPTRLTTRIVSMTCYKSFTN